MVVLSVVHTMKQILNLLKQKYRSIKKVEAQRAKIMRELEELEAQEIALKSGGNGASSRKRDKG